MNGLMLMLFAGAAMASSRAYPQMGSRHHRYHLARTLLS